MDGSVKRWSAATVVGSRVLPDTQCRQVPTASGGSRDVAALACSSPRELAALNMRPRELPLRLAPIAKPAPPGAAILAAAGVEPSLLDWVRTQDT